MGTVSVTWIDSGDSGVAATFTAMAQLANGGQTSPAVVGMARTLAASSRGRSQTGWALAIQGWLADVWVFVEDPIDTEPPRHAGRDAGPVCARRMDCRRL